MRKKITIKVLLYVLFVFLAMVILLPMGWMILNSLKTNQELFKNSLTFTPSPQCGGRLQQLSDLYQDHRAHQ